MVAACDVVVTVFGVLCFVFCVFILWRIVYSGLENEAFKFARLSRVDHREVAPEFLFGMRRVVACCAPVHLADEGGLLSFFLSCL